MSVAFDQITSVGTAAALRDEFEQALAMVPAVPLRWTPGLGGTTTVDFRVAHWGAQPRLLSFEMDHLQCTDRLVIPVTLRMTTADGLIDENIEGEISSYSFAGQLKTTGSDQSMFISQLPQRLQTSSLQVQSCGLYFQYPQLGFEFPVTPRLTGLIQAAADVDFELSLVLGELATFDSSWPKDVPIGTFTDGPAIFDEACESAAPTSWPVDLPGGSLMQALVGRWVLCEGTTTRVPSHAGLEIAADGSWNHVDEQDGMLRELLGFLHEGKLVLLGDDSLWFQGGVLATARFSEDRKTLNLRGYEPGDRGFELTYLASTLPVGPAQPRYTEGERAGSAACGEPEAYVHRFASTQDLRSQLAGSWHICTGPLRADASRIAFALDGGYLHQDADGRTVGQGHYEIVDTSSFNGDGAFQINLLDSDAPADRSRGAYAFPVPVMSRAPIKLWADDGDGRLTILSAMP